MTERVDCVVIGAGVVGLAVARALALAGREVTIVEGANAIGTGVSSRNSEVIHAGIHDAPDSLKAAFCVPGKALLYAYCAERRVPHRRVGKLVVATDAGQCAALDHIAANARACGVDDLERWSPRDVARLEPEVACVAALWCPSTGIVDTHALMLSLLADAEAAGATLALSSRVVDGAATADGVRLRVVTGHDDASNDGIVDGDGASEADPIDFVLEAAWVVNCASLDASRVARAIEGMPASHVPRTCRVKGNYFGLDGRAPFSHLIYPVPEGGGLGVHVTLDLGGRVRFGPDVQWPAEDATGGAIDHRAEYAVDESRAAAFRASIRRYWPGLPDDALSPAYVGIRPRISARGEPLRDFVISGPDDHGVAGLIHLFGIESPGLTSSLAIGEHVAAMVADTSRSCLVDSRDHVIPRSSHATGR